MRLKIYPVLLLISFVGIFAGLGNSHSLVEKFSVAIFTPSAFLLVVGLPTGIALIIFPETFMRLTVFVVKAFSRNEEQESETELDSRQLVMDSLSGNFIAAGCLCVLFGLISAIKLFKGDASEMLASITEHSSGFVIALICSIFFLLVSRQYWKMTKNNNSDKTYLAKGECIAIISTLSFVAAFCVYVLFIAGVSL